MRLPKVVVTWLGAAVVLSPKNHDWEVMFGALEGFGEDFMAERGQPALQERSCRDA